MITYTFCMLENGKLPLGIKETLARILPSFAGRKVKMSIAEAKEKRSLDQNAYYWVAIIPHIRQVRFDAGDPVTLDQCHEDLLEEFAPRVECKRFGGEGYTRSMRSKEMSVPEMANYLTAITARMAQFGNPIPLNEKQWGEQQ